MQGVVALHRMGQTGPDQWSVTDVMIRTLFLSFSTCVALGVGKIVNLLIPRLLGD